MTLKDEMRILNKDIRSCVADLSGGRWEIPELRLAARYKYGIEVYSAAMTVVKRREKHV